MPRSRPVREHVGPRAQVRTASAVRCIWVTYVNQRALYDLLQYEEYLAMINIPSELRGCRSPGDGSRRKAVPAVVPVTDRDARGLLGNRRGGTDDRRVGSPPGRITHYRFDAIAVATDLVPSPPRACDDTQRCL